MSDTYQRPRFGTPREPADTQNPGRILQRIVDFVVGSHARAVVFLIICGALFFLPGFFRIPPVDRDEARFAQASKQMVENGDPVDIRFQDEVRYKKPIGIYWLQSLSVKAASTVGIPHAQLRIWVYRLPSLFGAIGAVLLTYWTALAFVTRRGSLLAALMMCSCILLGVEARLAKTDAMLLLTTTAVMGALARTYLSWQRGEERSRSPWRNAAVFWTAVAGSILIKGPLILMFIALTVLTLAVLDRSIAWVWRLKPLAGIPWALLLILPWFVAIYLRSGSTFFNDAVGGDMLSKVAGGQESHGAPPGLYFLLFWVTFWPGSALAIMATPAIWRAKREPAAQFLLAWLIPSWIVFELVITKLPHYVLPLYPAVAILIIGALERNVLSRVPWIARGVSWWFVVPAVFLTIIVIGAMVITKRPVFAAWPFAAIAMILGLFAWWMYDEKHAERSLLNAVAASLALAFCVYGVVVPSLKPIFPSVQIAWWLRTVECKGPLAAAAGYQEPSLVFLTGTATLLTNGSGAADFLQKGSCRFALIEEREERPFAQRAETIGLHYAVVGRVDGYNISQGREISVAVFRSDSDE